MNPEFDKALNLFTTIFISIIMEAIPFLLLGTLLSSIIEVFVSEKFFEKHIPKNRHGAILLASFIGLVFPVCECAVIPVAARLLKKNVPLHFVTAFVLAVPIVNIPVILSTYYAFSGQAHIVVLRVGCGLLIAYGIGLLASRIGKKEVVVSDETQKNAVRHAEYSGESGHHGCSCAQGGHDEHHNGRAVATFGGKILSVLNHTTVDFFETGKYLLLGAAVASVFQSVVPRSVLSGLGGNVILSTAVMAFFAYILSVCSQTDAFIARSFLGQFPQGALVGFMVVGAMIDLKNTAMLARVIKRKYVAAFIVLVCLFGFSSSIVISLILGK